MEVDQIVVHYMDHENMAVDDQDGCTTPKRDECRIREMSAPPPPPRKRRFVVAGKMWDQPKNGYFHPPDLETFFAMAPRRACKFLHA